MHHWEIQWIYYLHYNACAHLILIRTCKNQTHQNKFELKATAECQIFISQRAVFNFTSAKSSDGRFNLVKVFENAKDSKTIRKCSLVSYSLKHDHSSALNRNWRHITTYLKLRYGTKHEMKTEIAHNQKVDSG